MLTCSGPRCCQLIHRLFLLVYASQHICSTELKQPASTLVGVMFFTVFCCNKLLFICISRSSENRDLDNANISVQYYVSIDRCHCWMLSGMPYYCGGATSVKYELVMTYPDTGSTEVVYHGGDTSCRVHSLQPGRSYRFQVRALNDAGVSFSCILLLNLICNCQ